LILERVFDKFGPVIKSKKDKNGNKEERESFYDFFGFKKFRFLKNLFNNKVG
jgi:hypothetical protein